MVDDGEAKPLLADLRATYRKHDTYASFSWDEADRLGIEMPDLAIVNDGEVKATLGTQFELPGMQYRTAIRDLSQCWLGSPRHPQVKTVRAYLAIARAHRLIVHTA